MALTVPAGVFCTDRSNRRRGRRHRRRRVAPLTLTGVTSLPRRRRRRGPRGVGRPRRARARRRRGRRPPVFVPTSSTSRSPRAQPHVDGRRGGRVPAGLARPSRTSSRRRRRGRHGRAAVAPSAALGEATRGGTPLLTVVARTAADAASTTTRTSAGVGAPTCRARCARRVATAETLAHRLLGRRASGTTPPPAASAPRWAATSRSRQRAAAARSAAAAQRRRRRGRRRARRTRSPPSAPAVAGGALEIVNESHGGVVTPVLVVDAHGIRLKSGVGISTTRGRAGRERVLVRRRDQGGRAGPSALEVRDARGALAFDIHEEEPA